ncbi:MAG: SHOCT domain-containing protein [Nitrospira sp.]|nr:SHOCT domain-containing protein [Nitrospira sp.]
MVFLVLLGTGCVGSPIFSRPVYQDPVLIVRLDSPLYKVQGDTPANSHPIAFTTQDLQSILQSLKIQREVSFLKYYVFRQDVTPQPVFPSEVAGLLAPHITTALSKAQPEEIVVYVISRSRDDGIPVITSGGLFVKGDQLTFVLAHVETPMTSERKREQVLEHPLTPLSDPDFHFVAGPSQALLTPTDASAFPPGRTSAPAVMIDYKALLTTHSQEHALPHETVSDSLPSSPPSTLEEKLRQLKSWHQEGLISEQEYRKKRQEILEPFQ